MTRYLTLSTVLTLYQAVMAQSGGFVGLQNRAALESAVAQPQATFDHQELYPTLPEKAAALGFALIRNHAFVDGNKRIGHATMEVFLLLNGFEILASVDEQEDLILQVAAGNLERQDLVRWLEQHLAPYQDQGR
ncbi:MAG: type II toxin-antitoxin system death-on-curing family toxin [Chloroflexales bacterium]